MTSLLLACGSGAAPHAPAGPRMQVHAEASVPPGAVRAVELASHAPGPVTVAGYFRLGKPNCPPCPEGAECEECPIAHFHFADKPYGDNAARVIPFFVEFNGTPPELNVTTHYLLEGTLHAPTPPERVQVLFCDRISTLRAPDN